MTTEEEITKLKKNQIILESHIQEAMQLIDALHLRLKLVEDTLTSLQSTPPSTPLFTETH